MGYSRAAPALLQVFTEKIRQFVKRDHIHPVVQVHMPGPGHPVKLLRLGGALVGVFAELPGMSFLPGDEKQGAGRNRLNIGNG